jgi:hypothetical protein
MSQQLATKCERRLVPVTTVLERAPNAARTHWAAHDTPRTWPSSYTMSWKPLATPRALVVMDRLALPPDQPPHEALGSTNATRAPSAPSSVSLPIRSRFQRPDGLAPPAPGPDGSLGLPDPLGAGFLGGAALAPFFVVVAWPVVSIRRVPPTPWVALDVPPPAFGPDGAVGLPDCWAFAIMTPPTSAAVASRLASIFIETSRDVPRNYRGARMPPTSNSESDVNMEHGPLTTSSAARVPPDVIPAPFGS